MCEHHDDHSYRTVDALAVMTNTGDAHLDYEGCLVESGEYVAALYESYAADQEWNNGDTYLTRPERTPVRTWAARGITYTLREYGDSLTSLTEYGRAAEALAEEIYQRDLDVAVASAETEADKWIFDNWS